MFYKVFKYNIFTNNFNNNFKYKYYTSLTLYKQSYLFRLLLNIKMINWLHKTILLNDFTLIWMKKEFLYTKLKYSRVPQFDIASGAAAALLAGLLGFIVTEKFGFELLDSGDFYMLVMYIGIIILILRLFIKSVNNIKTSFNIWNILYNFYNFYLTTLVLLYNYLIFIKLELSLWYYTKS